jgi:ubiquinone/menaquinone biosynthesis C-methylase UbiE
MGAYAPYYDLMTSVMFMGREKEARRMTVEMAGIKPGDAVLEIGCGTGSLTLAAKAQAGSNGRVCGIDAAPEMLEVARKKAKKNGAAIDFQTGLLQSIPYPDQTFDEVLCSFMIFHASEAERNAGFRQIARVLKPGGCLFIIDNFVPDKPRHNLMSHFSKGSMAGHDLRELTPLMAENGLIDVEYTRTRIKMLACITGKKPV